jgi:N-acyl-D-aspartate/D-glutamate deacylase
MSNLSLVIRNASIVDGTGAAARAGDVGVAGDRIVEVGRVDGRGEAEIDAAGLVLAPGFIDIHTHYDPQLCWDRLATPSPEHGVTSLVMGNCSISLAPVAPRDRDRLVNLFGSVENLQDKLFENTVPFTWEGFPEYLDYVRQGLGPNVGSFLGYSNLRLYVMGDAAQARAASDDEISHMCAVLREALRAGAVGLSFSHVHKDEFGNNLPGAYAERREKLALLQVMAEERLGVMEVSNGSIQDIDDWAELSLETGVTCSLSALLQIGTKGAWRTQLARFEHWRAKGAPIYAQSHARPSDLTVQLSEGWAHLSRTQTWRQAWGAPVPERIRRFADPALRPLLESEGEAVVAEFAPFMRVKAAGPANAAYLGRKLAEIAESEGKTQVGALLDVALADGLETAWGVEGKDHCDLDAVTTILRHPAVHFGSGDAGAHVAQFSFVGDGGYLIEKFVRQEGTFTLEEAVKRMTLDQATIYQIKDRGQIAAGKFADMVLFDPETITGGEEELANDFPGGQARYVRHPRGVEKVIVNGEVLVDRGSYTAARPGRIL